MAAFKFILILLSAFLLSNFIHCLMPKAMESQIMEITSYGLQLERNGIHAMYEQGHLSWETARELRNNITLLETQIE